MGVMDGHAVGATHLAVSLMQLPSAHSDGVVDGHDVVVGQVLPMLTQLPSGHTLEAAGHTRGLTQ